MKVKKYVAASLKEASEKIKKELGPEAVIIGTRVLDEESNGGKKMFEVTAGIEKDTESEAEVKQKLPQNEMTPGNTINELAKLTEKIYRKRNPAEKKNISFDKIKQKLKEEHQSYSVQEEIKTIEATLLHREIQEPIVRSVVDYLKDNINMLSQENIDKYVISNLSSMIRTKEFKVVEKNRPHKIAFVGPTGVGKTTCLAKLATISKILHNLDVGIISADTYRLGAIDQLKIFSEIIDIDFLVAYEPYELEEMVNKFRKKDIIFIDTAGRSQHKTEQLEKTREFLDTVDLDDVYLVLSATATTKNLYNVAESFQLYDYSAFVFSKIDESAAFGNILNVLTKYDSVPAIYLTNGQVIPDDIIAADPHFIANMIYTGKIMT